MAGLALFLLVLNPFILTPGSSRTNTAYPYSSDQAAPSQSSTTWASLGPSGFQKCGLINPYGSMITPWGTCSGRVTSISLDPAHPGTIYVGAASGGVWKSTNAGLTWTPLSDSLVNSSLAIGSLAVASDGTVYAGTGEGNLASITSIGSNAPAYYGTGLLKSTDGGNNWAQLGSSVFTGGAIDSLVVNATHSNLLLAATASAWSGASTGTTVKSFPAAPLGIYRSIDGGVSWARTITARTSNSTSLAADPTNSNIVYAAIDGTIYKSTNSGSTWSTLTTGLPSSIQITRTALAVGPPISPSTTSTVYAAADVNTVGELFRSTDGGASWSLIATPPGPFGGSFCDVSPNAQQCFYNLYVAPDPRNSNIIYLGGADVFRSTDGGVTWTDLGGYTGSIHVDQHAFAFNLTSATPTSTPGIIIGNDGGVWASSQGNTCAPSSCWKSLNQGLGITQFYTVAAHPTSPGTFFGGTQDNGVLNRNSTGWVQIDGGDGGWTGYNRKYPSMMYEVNNGVNPFRSDNRGVSWKPILVGIGLGDNSTFQAPAAMDPSTPSTLYLGTTDLYQTLNNGTSWQTLVTTKPLAERFSAISVAPSNGSYVYAGTETGRFYASNNKGQVFLEKDTGLPVSSGISRFLTKIGVDPLNPKVVVVTLSGQGGKHVYESQNSGTTWTDVTMNLPDYLGVDSVAIDRSETVYLGTDFGVFASVISLASWSRLGTGLPSAPVFDLEFAADGSLVAATYGRGLWTLTPSRVVATSLSLARRFSYATVSSVPIHANVTLTNSGMANETLTVRVLANSTLIGSGTITIAPGQTLNLGLSLNPDNLPRGAYTLTVRTPVIFQGGSFTVRLAGDVDNDCNVNLYDLVLVGGSIGSTPASAGWNPDADFNNDGVINSLDLSVAGGNFGNTC